MAVSNNKTSLLVSSILPFFVRNDHETFTRFIEAYYEFLEQEGQALNEIKNLRNNNDIDLSVDLYVEKFYENFLKLIPKEAEVDRTLLLKHAQEFYASRGTEKSIRFLMKILFNEEDVTFYYPKQDILKASDGKWFVEKSLKISDVLLGGVANNSTDAVNKFIGTKITGSKSSATAIVERVEAYYESSTLVTELKISNQYKEFSSGETITTSFTENGTTKSLSANLFSGALASVRVTEAGSGYQVGDTVNVESANGSGAVVIVSSVTAGNVKSILINDGGAGFQAGNQLLISGGGGTGANANISVVKADSTIHPNSYNIVTSTISLEANTVIGNTKYSNLSVSIANAANQWVSNLMSTFTYANTGPIQSVLVISGGTSYISTPTISAVANTRVRSLGILGRMKIVNGGSGYAVNDIITFNNVPGGYGSGAKANVFAVNATGAITDVRFVPVTGQITGGSGYDQNYLPTTTITSGGGTGANVVVTAVLGSGEDLKPYTGTIGSISGLTILSRGSGYNQPPTLNLASKGDGTAKATATIIQGTYTYPGRYLNDDGHLSGYNFIQNKDYYQNYSYVVKLRQSLANYRKALKELIHPAGMKMFGEFPVIDNGESMNVRITQTGSSLSNVTYSAGFTATTNANGKLIIITSATNRDLTSSGNGFFEFGGTANLVDGVYQTTSPTANTLRIYLANTAMAGTVVANNGYGNTYTLIGTGTNFTAFYPGDAFTIGGYANTFYVGAVANNEYLTISGTDYLPPYITGNTYSRIFLSSNANGTVSVTGNVSYDAVNATPDPYYMTEFQYLNFATLDGLVTQSVYGITDNNIYLTSYLAGNDAGNVFRASAIRFDRSFSMNWNMEIGGGSPNWADGFTLQWTTVNNQVGGSGTSAGRVGLASTRQAITFSTFSDPGIKWFLSNNLQVGAVVLPSATNTISWRQNVYYWLDYNHTAQTCKIFYSTTPTKPSTQQHTINSFNFDSTNYYVGFGAGTGGYTDNHILKSMALRFLG